MQGPNDVEIYWGGTAVFTCAATGDPQPSIFWMRNNEIIDINQNKYKIIDNGSLLIENIEESDRGYYECMAKNSDGEVKSRPARMILKRPEQTLRPSYGNTLPLV